MKNKIKKMLLVGLFTAFMGQVNFYPFGTDFRITVGVVIFTFMLLYFHTVPIVATSVITGISVLFFRVGIDLFFNAVSFDLAWYKHIPALVY